MDVNNKKLFDNCIEKWGRHSQILMAIEELSELMTVLCHSLRKNKLFSKNHLTEELADVKLMLDEVQYIFHISDVKLKLARNLKILRVEKMLNEGGL